MTRPASPYRDFCLWPYAPAGDAVPGSGDGAALLLLLAEAAGARAEWAEIVGHLQRGLGPYQTVWGLKWDGAALSTELYFYDYARRERRIGLAQARGALDAWLAPGVEVDPALPYFMVSFELPWHPRARAPLAEVDVYVGNPGSTVSSGLCHRHTAQGIELRNLYCFFDRAREYDAFLDKLACSGVQRLGEAELGALAPAWLAQCRTVVAANKRAADGAYFSGLRADAAARFIAECGWPAALCDALREAAWRFAHLTLDVGFDFRFEGGALLRPKSSLYGVC